MRRLYSSVIKTNLVTLGRARIIFTPPCWCLYLLARWPAHGLPVSKPLYYGVSVNGLCNIRPKQSWGSPRSIYVSRAQLNWLPGYMQSMAGPPEQYELSSAQGTLTAQAPPNAEQSRKWAASVHIIARGLARQPRDAASAGAAHAAVPAAPSRV